MNNEEIWKEEEKIRVILGAERLLDNIEKALDTDVLEDVLAYICRMNDIPTELKEKN